MKKIVLISFMLLAGCGTETVPVLSVPPATDLAPNDPEPVLDASAVGNNSDALDEYDVAHEAWGRRWHDALVRTCWWFRDRGVSATELPCEPKSTHP